MGEDQVIWSTGYLLGTLMGNVMLDRYGPQRALFFAARIILCKMLLILLGVSAASWKPLAPYLHVAALLVVVGLAGSGSVIDATANELIGSVYTGRNGDSVVCFTVLNNMSG